MKLSLSATASSAPATSPSNGTDRKGCQPLADNARSGPFFRSLTEAMAESDAVRGMEERYGIREEGLF